MIDANAYNIYLLFLGIQYPDSGKIPIEARSFFTCFVELVKDDIKSFIKYQITKGEYSYLKDYLDDYVDDIVSEIWLTLLVKRPIPKESEKFGSFILGISHNTMRNFIRNHKLKKSYSTVSTDEITESHEPEARERSPEENIIDKIAVTNALNDLSELHRNVIIKRYYEEKSYGIIALELGISYKKVDNAVYNAKRKLKELLDDPHIDSTLNKLKHTITYNDNIESKETFYNDSLELPSDNTET
jgi:RNA polymerase sigma-70 factor (ECF subfamily)